MGDQTAWLVELTGREPQWWSATFTTEDEPDGTFTRHADKALRFARREDAEAFIAVSGWTEAFATEHIWCAPKPLRTRNPLPSGVSRPDGSRP